MITKIVEQLKTGMVKNVVAYGQVKVMPAPPYIVVKDEVDPVGRGKIYRIIVHGPIGSNAFLKTYMANVQELLENFQATTYLGNVQRIYAEGAISGTIMENDDSTIAIERMYLCPETYF